MRRNQAAEYLRAAGLQVQQYTQRCDGIALTGAPSSISPHGRHFLGVNHAFFIAYESPVWNAHVIFGQTFPIIKSNQDLSVVVQAVEDFYVLCEHVDTDLQEIYRLISMLEWLPVVSEIYAKHLWRVRLPLTLEWNPAFHGIRTRGYRDEDFLIQLKDSQWSIDYRHGKKTFMTMPLLHLDEVVPALRPFCGPPTATAAHPPQSRPHQSTDLLSFPD